MTRYASHILQLIKRTVTPFEEVQDEIRAELEQQRATPREKAMLVKQLRQEAKIEM